MRFAVTWMPDIPAATPEERATAGELQIYVNESNSCLHTRAGVLEEAILLPLVHIAEGLAQDWWSIFGGRDRSLSLISYRRGNVVPDLRMAFDGSVFEARAYQYQYRNPPIGFWGSDTETLTRDQAESSLSNFIEHVLAQLVDANIKDSSVQLRWSRISKSRLDPEEGAFCEAAGALGVDPYQIDEIIAQNIEHSSELFSGEPLFEFLAGVQQLHIPTAINWVGNVEKRPGYKSRLNELNAIAKGAEAEAPPVEGEKPWALGYRRARAVRKLVALDETFRVSGVLSLARQFGASPHYSLAPKTNGLRALRSYDDKAEAHVHLKDHGKSPASKGAEVFALARAIGDACCYPDAQRAAVNELYLASRQAAGRAFAAEFLAPLNEIESMSRDGADISTIAGEFGVSPVVVEHQLENRLRIREVA